MLKGRDERPRMRRPHPETAREATRLEVAALDHQRCVERAQLPPENHPAVARQQARPTISFAAAIREPGSGRPTKVDWQAIACDGGAMTGIQRSGYDRPAAHTARFMRTIMNRRLQGRRQTQPLAGDRSCPQGNFAAILPRAMRQRRDNQQREPARPWGGKSHETVARPCRSRYLKR